MWKILLVIVLSCTVSIVTVHTCGITTHIEIGHRAATYFEYTDQYNIEYGKLIKDHQDAFQAGNPYPDAFYSDLCKQGKFHDVSEDTHWAPFLNVTINYIRKTYPQPWNEETEKLVVFMLGFVSHQVADVLWHSLGIDQGFLATMGQVNFFGSFSAAHSVGDEGGDVLTQYEFDTQYIGEIQEWYVPVQDLVAIYNEYYQHFQVDANVIEQCTSLLFLGRLGEKLAIAKLFPSYASKSPFLIEEFENYFLGGVDDMAVWTTNIWHASIFMLQHGTESCQIPTSPLRITCPDQVNFTAEESDVKMTGLHSALQINDLTLQDLSYRRTKRGIYISVSSNTKKTLAVKMNAKKKENRKIIKSTLQPQATFFVNKDYARLGWSFLTSDVNGDRVDDLVVGAPGFSLTNNIQLGCVYVVLGSIKTGLPRGEINLDSSADMKITGLQKNGCFGSAIAVLDINLDGIPDLVVSAPSVGSTSLSYYGEVYIYLGSFGMAFGSIPNITIKGENIENDYNNLGWTLSSGDVNQDGHDDLIMGSPFAAAGGQQRGMVNVLYADKKLHGYQNISIIDVDLIIKGDQDYAWFGSQVVLKKMKNGCTLMFVSQPTYRICAVEGCPYTHNDTQSVGRVLVYDIRNLSKPVQDLQGVHSFDKLGTSIDIGDPYHDGSDILALGIDTRRVTAKISGITTSFDQAGLLQLLNFTAMSTSTGACQHNASCIPQVAVFKGDRNYARFGMTAKLMDVTGDEIDDLVVSAPFRIDDITEELVGGDTGIVYVFKGGKGLGRGDVTMQCSGLARFVQPCPGEKATITLTTNERGSHFGKGLDNWKIQNATVLITSSVDSNNGGRKSGALYLYSLSSKHQ